MLYLLYTNLTFFDSFLVFWEYFQLRHVSSFILDQYLIAVNFLKKNKIQSMQDWRATTRHGVTRERSTKRFKDTEYLLRKNPQ